MFRYFSNFDRTFNEQTVETLIRHRALLHLIWVQTVCLCPPPPQKKKKKKKDAICAYGLVIRYDLHNYGRKQLMASFSTQLWIGWWLHVFVHLSVLPVLGFLYRHVRRVWGRMSMVKVVSLMRIGDMNWWLIPTPSNNLMKCNPKYPSVKQLWIMQVCLSYVNLHFVMYIISPEIN